jgi:protocatechuate 3,4-dioxygenase beta subunit
MDRHRRLVACAVASAIAVPALAARRPFAEMTDGPFYPPPAWRERWPDWDADLTRVQRGGRTLVARGEALGLALRVVDTEERPLDGAEVEIWQCDAAAVYHHPAVGATARDEGFQGFGAAKSGRDGAAAFRTIRPVPYPGRTPHIHVKVRHPAFGAWTSQLFVAGDPGNPRDFLWRSLRAEDRAALEMRLARAGADGLAWTARHDLVVPA